MTTMTIEKFDEVEPAEVGKIRVLPYPESDEVIAIRHQAKFRRVLIRSQIRLSNEICAEFRTALGWNATLPAKEATRIKKLATTMVSALYSKCDDLVGQDISGSDLDDDLNAAIDGMEFSEEEKEVANNLSSLLITFHGADAPVSKHRELVEDKMVELAEKLPAAEWASGVRGFSLLALARIVGECGNLSNYPNPKALCRRLGVAPFNGKALSTWRLKGGLTAEEWSQAGYCPRRRSESWSIMDIILRCNKQYQEIYNNKKKELVRIHPEFFKGMAKKTNASGEEVERIASTAQCNLMAKRYAESKFIKHLWRAWRKADGLDEGQRHPNDND